MINKRFVIRITGIIAVIVSLWYVIHSFISSGALTNIRLSTGTIFLIALLSILYSSGNFLRAFNWGIILNMLSKAKIPFKPLIAIYLKTEIIKYIPSNIMHFAGRHILAKQHGANHKAAAASNIFDMGFILTAAAAVSLPALFISKDLLPSEFITAVYSKKFILGGIAVLLFFSFLIILYIKRKHITSMFSSAIIKKSALILLIDIIVFILNGMLFWFLLQSLRNSGGISFITTITLYALCWMAGFIVPGSPGGLGIREALIVFVFGGIYGESGITLAAILMRIVSIAGDGISLAIGVKLTSK